MNYFDFVKKEQLTAPLDNEFNAIVLPSMKRAKYIIDLSDKRTFFAGLDLLNLRSIKARIAKYVYSCLYRFRIIKRILKSQLVTLNREHELFKNIYQQCQHVKGINIYIGGAKNENLSLTLQIVGEEEQYYLRYPISDTAKILQAQEFANIKYLYQFSTLSIQKLHQLIYLKDNALPVYEGIPSKITCTKLCNKKIDILRALASPSYEPINQNVYFRELCALIEQVIRSATNLEIRKLIDFYQDTVSYLGPFSVKKAFFHGDFSPDNLLISNDICYLIDFEYSHTDFFTCFDLFHYFYKAKKLHLKAITKKDIQELDNLLKIIYLEYPFFGEVKFQCNELINFLFIFYLFFLLKRYLMDEKVNEYSFLIKNLTQSILILSNHEANMG